MPANYVRIGPPQRKHRPVQVRTTEGRREKRCVRCRQWLELGTTCFHRDARLPFGLRNECKLCHVELYR